MILFVTDYKINVNFFIRSQNIIERNFSFVKAGLVFERANKASSEGARVEAEALKVRKKLLDGAEQVKMIVAEINRLVIGLETGTGKKVIILLHLPIID